MISTTVINADVDGMARTYHPDAVVVNANGTTPIREQIAKWGRDMVAATRRGEKATVEFRFSRRQDDATSAFEAGIFMYTVTDKSGTSTAAYVPFESLLVRRRGRWLTVMERQFAAVTVEEWNRLR